MVSNRVFACVALASLLAACSPAATTDADEKSFRAESAKEVSANNEKPMPVLDAQGNELDPELADAVREKMEEDKAALESGGDDASAPTDDGATASDGET